MISVILATHNGAHTLPRMLRALEHLTPPRRAWELIAVDNASTDDSTAILRSAEATLPLRCLHHPERGKNRALNAALPLARGDLIVFTDDDVLPDAGWLRSLESAAERRPEYDLFGGAIAPHWESPPPGWILEHVPLGITYAVTEADLPEGDIFPGLIWGPNMMIRRKVFDAGLRFNEAVGPAAGQYAMGSETEFNLRAAAAGHRCCFVPEARVQHIVRAHQVEREWVLQRAYRFGRNSWNQERQSPPDSAPRLFGVHRWRYRSFVEHYLRSRWLHLKRRNAEAFAHDWEVSFLLGYFAQAKHARTACA